MQPATRAEILRRLRALIPRGTELESRSTWLSIDRYHDPAQFDVERRALFRRWPVSVAHVSELARPGDCVSVTLGDAPVVLVNDAGQLRAFLNACRHRGAELVGPGTRCSKKKAFVCPYHGWSYRLDGSLLHVPREEAFVELPREQLALRELASEVRHGFVWICLEGPVDVEAFLGPQLDADFAGFEIARHAQDGIREHRVEANWKLVMDAFAEGYHLPALHRSTLSRFFTESFVLDDLDPHVRQVGARRSLATAAQPTIRDDTTPFYNLFPNSFVVFHPLWISWATLLPEAVDRVRVVHRMLVHPDGASQQDKLRRSFQLIDEQVFSGEDLSIAASIQRTLRSGANDRMLLGEREEGMRLFHRNRDRALEAFARKEARG